MKTSNIKAFLLIITIVFSSCGKSDFDKSPSPTLLKCKLLNTIGTKTQHDFDGNYLNIKWKRGDLIAVSDGNHWYKFGQTGDISSNGKETFFSHYGSDACVKFPKGQTIAVYPYQSGWDPSSQKYITSLFGFQSQGHIAVEVLSKYDILLGRAVTSGSDEETLEFSPLCAMLRLPKGTLIAKEQYTGDVSLLLSGENICNALIVSPSGNLELNVGNIQASVYVTNGALIYDYYLIFIPNTKTGTFSYKISNVTGASGGGVWSFSITDISTTCIYSLKKIFQ